jgi:hypothetical protein
MTTDPTSCDASVTRVEDVSVFHSPRAACFPATGAHCLPSCAEQDHLRRVSLEVLAALTSKNVLPPPFEDLSAAGAQSTKGQASKAIRVVLASNRFKMAGSERSLRAVTTADDNAGGGDGGGSAGAAK